MSVLKSAAPRCRRWALWVLCLTLACLIGAGAVVYTVDPFQLYRQMTRWVPVPHVNLQAYYNLGFAKNYPYNTLMLGSSMTENTWPSVVEAQFGGQAINIPFSGGTLPAYDRMMKVAFANHSLKRVFFCLDSFALATEPGETSMYFPPYLYDNNPLTDVSYLLSMDTLERVVDLLTYNQSGAAPEKLNLDTIYDWSDESTFSRRRTLLSYGDFDKPIGEALPREGRVAQMQANIQQYLLPYVEAYPETEFIFYFPPYSALQWFSEYQRGLLERQLFYREYYAQALLPYPNVKLFDFQAYRPWVEDLDNFKDMAHYGPDINQALTPAMAEGLCLVTDMTQLQANNGELRDIAMTFPVPTAEELAELQAETAMYQ